MGNDSIAQRATGSAIDDVAYLSRSPHRVPVLKALTVRPRSRSELCELVDVSASTMRRTLGAFERRQWVSKEGYRYRATRLGQVVADAMDQLLSSIETERTMRDVAAYLPEAIVEAPVDTWASMTVTVAEPAAPYRPINRFSSLLAASDGLRFVRPAVAMMEPCFDLLQGRVDDGMEVVLIGQPQSHDYFRATYPSRSEAMLEQENITVLEHDDLPSTGVGLLDDCVVISCCDPDRGTVHAVVDTAEPSVIEWARALIERYTTEARPLLVH